MRYPTAIIFILLLLPVLAWAQLSGDSAERPLRIYADKRADNENVRERLVGAYGQQEFNRCFSCSARDVGNPFALSACLARTGYCLEDRGVPVVSCDAGYVASAGRCVSANGRCKELYGQHSFNTGTTDRNGNNICGCLNGFNWNNDRSQCIQTGCPDGYIYYSQYKTSFGDFLHGRCMTRDHACMSEYGESSYFARISADGGYYCGCRDGYDWGADSGTCEEVVVKGITSDEEPDPFAETILRETELSVETDSGLAERLAGMILLQVEERGEAWYVNPNDNLRYFLYSPTKAFEVMREFGLGAPHDFIETHEIFPDWVSGKILIDVEDSGKAYYVYPRDKKAYYLGRPEDAFSVMWELGLGISNKDVRKIGVGRY